MCFTRSLKPRVISLLNVIQQLLLATEAQLVCRVTGAKFLQMMNFMLPMQSSRNYSQNGTAEQPTQFQYQSLAWYSRLNTQLISSNKSKQSISCHFISISNALPYLHVTITTRTIGHCHEAYRSIKRFASL